MLTDELDIALCELDTVLTRNAFCPTGEGGGVDPSCSPGSKQGPRLVSGPFAKPSNESKSEPGYHYHATTVDRAHEIAESGKLKTHRPGYGTDQSAWPDGATEKRAYFTPNAGAAWQFAPEEGKPVLLRVHESKADFRKESTGDTYTRKSVPAGHIEIQRADGTWVPLVATGSGVNNALRELDAVLNAGDNCGTGAGGFQEGNKCSVSRKEENVVRKKPRLQQRLRQIESDIKSAEKRADTARGKAVEKEIRKAKKENREFNYVNVVKEVKHLDAVAADLREQKYSIEDELKGVSDESLPRTTLADYGLTARVVDSKGHQTALLTIKKTASQATKNAIREWSHYVDRGTPVEVSMIRSSERSGKLNRRAKTFNAVLDKMPKYDGMVFRGLEIPEGTKQFDQLTTVGYSWTSKTSDSTSKLATKAAAYGNLILKIRCKTGADISSLEGVPNKEVVTRRGTRYRVTKVYPTAMIRQPKRPGYKGGHQRLTIVEVEEVGRHKAIVNTEGNNCGTGVGGFQEGNSCAAGRGKWDKEFNFGSGKHAKLLKVQGIEVKVITKVGTKHSKKLDDPSFAKAIVSRMRTLNWAKKNGASLTLKQRLASGPAGERSQGTVHATLYVGDLSTPRYVAESADHEIAHARYEKDPNIRTAIDKVFKEEGNKIPIGVQVQIGWSMADWKSAIRSGLKEEHEVFLGELFAYATGGGMSQADLKRMPRLTKLMDKLWGKREVAVNVRNNCGTGAGGFQEGNTCAAGDKGSEIKEDLTEKKSKHYGSGWWYNTEQGKVVAIDPGDLGPHGDHDGWISVGDNAAKIGVDQKAAKAFQAATYGFMLEDHPEFKKFADPDDDYFDPNSDRVYKRQAAFEKLFKKTFGMTTDAAMDAQRKMPLVRIRDWGKGEISIAFNRPIQRSDWEHLAAIRSKLFPRSHATKVMIYSDSSEGFNGTVSAEDFQNAGNLRDLESLTGNAFCATGKGGGQDNSCSSSQGSTKAEVARAKRGDQDAVAKVLKDNQGLVHKIAHRYAKPTDSHYDDLVQEGNLGLLRAIETFNPKRGTQFSTHAFQQVRGRISSAAKARWRIAARERQATEEKAKAKEPAAPVLPESRSQELIKALGELEARSRDILERRYGLGGQQRQTDRQVAKLYGLSKARIGQIAARSLKELRSRLTDNALLLALADLDLALNTEGGNCGTGAGGFQEGNTCGASDKSKLEVTRPMTKEEETWAKNHRVQVLPSGKWVLYHGTTEAKAALIRKSGTFNPGTYFTDDPSHASYEGGRHGSKVVVLKVAVRPEDIYIGVHVTMRRHKPLPLEEVSDAD